MPRSSTTYWKRIYWLVLFGPLVVEELGVTPPMSYSGDFVCAIACSCVTLTWCTVDANTLGRALSPLFKMGVVWLPIVFVPIYLVRTRGRSRAGRGIFVFVLQTIGIVLCLVIVTVVVDVANAPKS